MSHNTTYHQSYYDPYQQDGQYSLDRSADRTKKRPPNPPPRRNDYRYKPLNVPNSQYKPKPVKDHPSVRHRDLTPPGEHDENIQEEPVYQPTPTLPPNQYQTNGVSGANSDLNIYSNGSGSFHSHSQPNKDYSNKQVVYAMAKGHEYGEMDDKDTSGCIQYFLKHGEFANNVCRALGDPRIHEISRAIPPQDRDAVATGQKLSRGQPITKQEEQEYLKFCNQNGIPPTERGLGDWLKKAWNWIKGTPNKPAQPKPTGPAPPPKPVLTPGQYDIIAIQAKAGNQTAEEQMALQWARTHNKMPPPGFTGTEWIVDTN
jgi:hypothetical protein